MRPQPPTRDNCHSRAGVHLSAHSGPESRPAKGAQAPAQSLGGAVGVTRGGTCTCYAHAHAHAHAHVHAHVEV